MEKLNFVLSVPIAGELLRLFMNKKCLVGFVTLFVWTVSQSVQFTLHPVYENLYNAAVFEEGGYLMMAAMWLILNNACRAVFLYSGWFIFSDGVSEFLGYKRLAWIMPLIAIPISYLSTIFFNLPSVPHFGVPAILTLAGVWVLHYITSDVTKGGYKLLVQALLVFSIQWLDLIPLLTHYGFGWGELSSATKNEALLMGKDSLLNMFCGLGFAANASVALLLTKLFVSYEKQIRQLTLLRTRERELNRLRQEQSKSRLYREMQYLVHDLKRPLTTVLGLADLLSLSKDRSTESHAKEIAAAAEKMDQMISEIKNPQAMRSVSFEELINYTMSQVRVMPWGASVDVDCPLEGKPIWLNINLIRFSRVLVNLLDNAYHATENIPFPQITLRSRGVADGIFIYIEDNGIGFSDPCDGAPSAWGSTGLGLIFAGKAIKESNGTMEHAVRPGGGTCCTIWMPAVREEV